MEISGCPSLGMGARGRNWRAMRFETGFQHTIQYCNGKRMLIQFLVSANNHNKHGIIFNLYKRDKQELDVVPDYLANLL